MNDDCCREQPDVRPYDDAKQQLVTLHDKTRIVITANGAPPATPTQLIATNSQRVSLMFFNPDNIVVALTMDEDTQNLSPLNLNVDNTPLIFNIEDHKRFVTTGWKVSSAGGGEIHVYEVVLIG